MTNEKQKPVTDEYRDNWDKIFDKNLNQKPEKCINYEIEADNDHAEILATIPFGR